MIPLRDTVRSRNFPVVNTLIIGLNIVAFLWQLSQGNRLEEAFYLYGVLPLRYSDPDVSVHFTTFQQLLPFLTSMFLHGGLFHILGNMWFLYIFGDNVEDHLGHIRYFMFYILCGVTAGLIHLLTNWDSKIPTVGASGAIAGVMGGYLLLYLCARILTLIPIIFFFQVFEIPAFIFLGYWFLIQIVSGSLAPSDVGGVAWWAHIGGFVSGVIFVKVLGMIPRMGLNEGLRHHTERQRTPRLHKVSPTSVEEELDLEGQIAITPREARFGSRKLISVPQGFRKRTGWVTIPPGVKDGTQLRLRGMGKSDDEGNRGDLLLEVRVRNE